MSKLVNKKNIITLSTIVIALFTIIITGTYAYQQLGVNNSSATGTGGCFNVNYTGQNLTASDITTTTSFSEGAQATVTLSKNTSCKIYTEANIYLKTNNSTTAPIESVQAFKYKIYSGSSQISEGIITSKNDYLLATVPITDTATTYTVYLWIDSNLSAGYYTDKTYSGYIYATSSQTSTIEGNYLVNFDTNNEENLSLSKTVTNGQTYGWLPSPSKPGFIFKGWNGKNLINDEEIRKYSNWKTNIVANGGYPTNSGNHGFLLNLDAGKTYTISITTQGTNSGENPPYLYLCKELNNNGYLVAYLTTTSLVNSNYTFTPAANEKYFLRIGGSGNETQFNTNISKLITIQLEENSTATTYEPYYVTSSTQVTQTKNHTLTAQWEPITQTVRFNANGGTVGTTSKQVTYGSTYGDLPTPTKSGKTFKGWTIAPTGYHQVEYIEGTGTQYIDTDAQIFDATNHEITIDFAATSFYNYNSLYGSTVDADSFEGWVYSNGQLAARYNNIRYGSDNAITVDTRYLFTAKKIGTTLYKYLNNSQIGTGSATAALTDAKKAAKIKLFLSGSDYGKYKMYASKLYRENELVRNYIPCIDENTSKYGLCDLVNNKFYPNAATSGNDFSHGSNVYITSSSTVNTEEDHTLSAVWE